MESDSVDMLQWADRKCPPIAWLSFRRSARELRPESYGPQDRCGNPATATVVDGVLENRQGDTRGAVHHRPPPRRPTAACIEASLPPKQLVSVKVLTETENR